MAIETPAFSFKTYAEFIRTEAMSYGSSVAKATDEYLGRFPKHADALKAHVDLAVKDHQLLSTEVETIRSQRQGGIGRPNMKDGYRQFGLGDNTLQWSEGYKVMPKHGMGGGLTLGAMGALVAGGTAIATGANAQEAVKDAGVALANVIPGVNIFTAPNEDERKVRSDVALATGGTTAIGVPFGVVGGVVTGLVGNLISDEIARGYARHVEGKTNTVAPAAGESLVTGVADLAGRAVKTVQETLSTAVDHLTGGTPSSAGVPQAKPVTKDTSVAKK